MAYAGRGCAACAGVVPGLRPAPIEVVVRAGLAGIAAAVVGGWIVTQHVNVHYMSLIAPGLLGLAASWAAAAAGDAQDARQGRAVLGVAAVAALLGTALGFRLFGRPITPVHPLHQVGPPYLGALVGVIAWPLLFGAPSRSRGKAQPAAGSGSDL